MFLVAVCVCFIQWFDELLVVLADHYFILAGVSLDWLINVMLGMGDCVLFEVVVGCELRLYLLTGVFWLTWMIMFGLLNGYFLCLGFD